MSWISGLGGGILGAASNIVGGIMSYKGQKAANKTNLQIANQTNQMNRELAQGAQAHDVAMWNRQNEYNTPQAQMQRLQEAGLNPNLIYEGGAGSAGNAGSAPKAPVPHMERAQVNNELASMATMNIMPAIAQYQDWQVKKAQIDNIKAQTQATIDSNIGTRLRNILIEAETPFASQYAENKSLKAQGENELLRTRNLFERSKHLNFQQFADKLSETQLEGQKLTNRQKLLEIQLDENLKPYGMHKGDELWQRILLPHLLKGINPVLNKISNKFLK